MARGRMRADWDRSASMMALMANVNRDSKKRKKPYGIMDFHPFISEAEKRTLRRSQIPKIRVKDLKGLMPRKVIENGRTEHKGG